MSAYTYLGDFKVVDTNRFWLKVNSQPNTWLHIASIQAGLREYVYFYNVKTSKLYIEEITTGKLEMIKENNLFEELSALIEDEKYNWIFKGQDLNDVFALPHDFMKKHF